MALPKDIYTSVNLCTLERNPTGTNNVCLEWIGTTTQISTLETDSMLVASSTTIDVTDTNAFFAYTILIYLLTLILLFSIIRVFRSRRL